MPDVIARLTGLYEAYFAQVQAAQRRLGPANGLFGLGERLANAPCHDAFLETVQAFFSETDVLGDPGQVLRALRFVYSATFAYTQVHQAVYWMLIAAHSVTLQAIESLRPGDAGELYRWYQDSFPKRERLPVQNQVLNALKQRSRQA